MVIPPFVETAFASLAPAGARFRAAGPGGRNSFNVIIKKSGGECNCNAKARGRKWRARFGEMPVALRGAAGYNKNVERVSGMANEEKILEMLEKIVDKMDEHDKRFEALETDVRHTRMLMEKQEHHVRLIAEQYDDIAKKLDKANEKAAQIDDLKDRVRTLETVVRNHTVAIQELRKAE